MSDHERGAYTPQPDAPLSFDPRISRERRPMPLLLIASCVVLSTLVVALFLLYRSGVRGPNDAPMPVGTPVEQYKSPPPANAVPNSLAVQLAPEPAATAIAPAPEQPINRAAAPTTASPAPVQTAPAATAPAPASVAQQTAPAPPSVTPAKPVVRTAASVAEALDGPRPAPVAAKPKPAAKTVVAKLDATEPAAKPAPAKAVAAKPAAEAPAPKSVAPKPLAKAPVVAKAKPVMAEAAPAAGGAVVQIGAYVSDALAKDSWQKVAGLMGGQISGKGKHVEPVEVGGVTRYRSQVTGFAGRAEAAAFCAALKAKGHDCIVKAGN